MFPKWRSGLPEGLSHGIITGFLRMLPVPFSLIFLPGPVREWKTAEVKNGIGLDG